MDPTSPPDSTVTLLERVRSGDNAATDALMRRYLPRLRAWAHGRVPPAARGLSETDDVVQIAMVGALNRLGAFEVRHEGAFMAYLRHSVLNAIRSELRRASRRPQGGELTESQPDPGPSVVERHLGREFVERYEAALLELGPDQREAIILRIEFGFSYGEVAEAIGNPSANATRMLVVRGLARIAARLGGRQA
jgi:RNA polymerase sigma-70 factor (ECF subfamily)